MVRVIPADTVTLRPTVACLACSRVVAAAQAFAQVVRDTSPQAFFCRPCAAILVLAPFRRRHLATVFHEDHFPKWAVLALVPAFSIGSAGRTSVARFIREAPHEHVP